MRVEDCFRERKLRKVQSDPLKVGRALEAANEKLKRAEELHNKGFFEEAVVASYSSMFQGARALLFKDGIIEKNHYCVILYLNERYLKEIGPDMVQWLDTYRVERHQWFYGTEPLRTSEDESSMSIERAGEFLRRIEKELVKA